MRITSAIVYGVTASALVASLSIAVQWPFGRTPELDHDAGLAEAAPAATPDMRIAPSGGDDSLDVGADAVPSTSAGRALGAPRKRGIADATAASRPRTSPPAPSSAAPMSWNPLSALARWFGPATTDEAIAPPAGAAPAPSRPSPPATSATPPLAPEDVRHIRFGESRATACQSGARDFGLSEVRDIYVCVTWSGLAGSHSAQLAFVSPDGNDYQNMTLPLVAADTADAADAPPDLQSAVAADGRARVVATLAVAGTYITRYKLAGIWTVKASVDGHDAEWEQFTLHPPR